MPNKTLTVNLDPRAEAKLSGFFDGLTANLRIVTEEYERVLCFFQQANKAKREARRELKAEKQWWQETIVPFLEWAQSYLDSGRWAGHNMFDAIKTELLERDAERNLWEKRANALLDIAKAATAIVEAPYLIRDRGNYLITQTEFEALKRAVEDCKRLSEAEVQK